MTQPTEYEQVTYNAPDGAQVGKGATEKVGFFGATPVAQRTSSAQTTLTLTIKHTAAYGFSTSAQATAVKNQLAEICATLKTLGLWKGS
jgi:hypothetical protein